MMDKRTLVVKAIMYNVGCGLPEAIQRYNNMEEWERNSEIKLYEELKEE